MEVFKEALNKLFTRLQQNLSFYVTVIVTVSYHLAVEKDFACSCRPQNQQQSTCMMHLFLPALLLLVILVLSDKVFRRMFLTKCCKTIACVVGVRVIHALCVCLIWLAVVLMDGDWYLCCRNNGTQIQATVACKSPSERSTEENFIAADLKNQSRSWGLVVLLIAAALALLVPFVQSCCKPNNSELTRVILEDGQEEVFNLLHKAALQHLTERVKTHMQQRKWKECTEEVGKLIEEMTTTTPQQQTPQQQTPQQQTPQQQTPQQQTPQQRTPPQNEGPQEERIELLQRAGASTALTEVSNV